MDSIVRLKKEIIRKAPELGQPLACRSHWGSSYPRSGSPDQGYQETVYGLNRPDSAAARTVAWTQPKRISIQRDHMRNQ